MFCRYTFLHGEDSHLTTKVEIEEVSTRKLGARCEAEALASHLRDDLANLNALRNQILHHFIFLVQ